MFLLEYRKWASESTGYNLGFQMDRVPPGVLSINMLTL